MSAEPAPYLIAAASGRALAASAMRGGYDVAVLDWFADLDTQALARAVRKVAEPGALRFDARALLDAADVLAPAHQCPGVIYGAGFEDCPTLLRALARGRPLLGNACDTVAQLKDPARFFRLLDELEIAHPEVALEPPADPSGWLAKRAGGSGGAHVAPAGRALRAEGASYYQRRVPGAPLSLLFVADGKRALPIAVSALWCAEGFGAMPYLHGGVAGPAALAPPLAEALGLAAARITEACALQGLNGIDVLAQGEDFVVLEVNPRPTAALVLYDHWYEQGLFDAHVRACLGELPRAPSAPDSQIHGSEIVYAPHAGVAGAQARPPEWLHDLPVPGSALAPGDPLCSVSAHGDSLAAVRQMLGQRHAESVALLLERAT